MLQKNRSYQRPDQKHSGHSRSGCRSSCRIASCLLGQGTCHWPSQRRTHCPWELPPLKPPLELPPELPLVVLLIPAIRGRGVAGGAQAKNTKKIMFIKNVDFRFIINGKGTKILTRFFQIKALFKDINQWIFFLVTESAHVVIHVKGPHHGTSKVTLHQPVNLQTARSHCKKHFEVRKITASSQDLDMVL